MPELNKDFMKVLEFQLIMRKYLRRKTHMNLNFLINLYQKIWYSKRKFSKCFRLSIMG